jgi:hypothetical protein
MIARDEAFQAGGESDEGDRERASEWVDEAEEEEGGTQGER